MPVRGGLDGDCVLTRVVGALARADGETGGYRRGLVSRTVGRPVEAWAGRRHVAEVEGRVVLTRGSGGGAARDMAECPSSSCCGIPASTESLAALAMVAALEIRD